MSNYTATHSYVDREEIEICDYCGCEFKIIILKQDGHNDTEEYQCPECRKIYKAKACITPDVSLKKKRNDGHTDVYKDNH